MLARFVVRAIFTHPHFARSRLIDAEIGNAVLVEIEDRFVVRDTLQEIGRFAAIFHDPHLRALDASNIETESLQGGKRRVGSVVGNLERDGNRASHRALTPATKLLKKIAPPEGSRMPARPRRSG